MAKTAPFTAGDNVIDDARDYREGTPVFPQYRFPFVALDSTKGGGNLGRIEWCVELLPATKRKGVRQIGALAIWAKQTRDPRYTGRVFYLPCRTDALTTSLDRDEFMRYVWYIGLCNDHGAPILMAYPDNDHTALVVEASSSLSASAWFE